MAVLLDFGGSDGEIAATKFRYMYTSGIRDAHGLASFATLESLPPPEP
jgi:hypothetical protein